MRFSPIEMLAWARDAIDGATYYIGRSGMPAPPPSFFGDALQDLPWDGPPAGSGEPTVTAALAERFGVDSEEILLAPGTTGANFYAAAALVDAGDEVLVEQPTYGPLLQLAQGLTGNVKRFPRPAKSRWQPDLDRLGELLSQRTKLVVVTNLHNPSGALIPADAMERLLDLVEARSPAHLLVDEVYLELDDDLGATAYRAGRRAVTTRSLTKAYGLSWLRAGWVTAPRALIERARAVRDYASGLEPAVTTFVMAEALRRLPALRMRTRQAIDASERAFRGFLAGRGDLELVWPRQPFIVFPRVLRAGTTVELAVRLRSEAGVAAAPGELFGAPGHLRLGAVGEPEILAEGLSRLGAILDTLPLAEPARAAATAPASR